MPADVKSFAAPPRALLGGGVGTVKRAAVTMLAAAVRWLREINPRGWAVLLASAVTIPLSIVTGAAWAHPAICAPFALLGWMSGTVLRSAIERERDHRQWDALSRDREANELRAPFLLEAQREVDALLPGTPAIAPPKAAPSQVQQAAGAQNAYGDLAKALAVAIAPRHLTQAELDFYAGQQNAACWALSAAQAQQAADPSVGMLRYLANGKTRAEEF